MPKKKDIKIEDEEEQVGDEEQVDDEDSEESEESESSVKGSGNSSDSGDDSEDDSDDDLDVDVDSLIAEVEASQGNDAIRRREIRRRLEEIREARESARANAEPFDDLDGWD
jgi:hypothetical protein